MVQKIQLATFESEKSCEYAANKRSKSKLENDKSKFKKLFCLETIVNR